MSCNDRARDALDKAAWVADGTPQYLHAHETADLRMRLASLWVSIAYAELMVARGGVAEDAEL